MREFILGICVALNFISALKSQMDINGQTLYGNEWIDYSRDYYKFKISKDGIYRITYQDLLKADFPVASVKGDQLQLFTFGQEIPIRVSTNENFGENDFFEFYGRKNRGELDRHIYEDPEERQLNLEYSLFSDTLTYYLSWNDSQNNKRYQHLNNNISGDLPIKESFYFHEENTVYSSFHLKPSRNGIDRIRYSSLDVSEGFGSDLRRTQDIEFKTTNVFTSGPLPSVRIRFGGNSTPHITELSLNGNLISAQSYSGYEVREFFEEFDINELKNTTEFRVYGSSSSNDRSVLATATLAYPREFDFQDSSVFIFKVQPELANKYFEIANFNLDGGPPVLYDVTKELFLETSVSNDTVKFLIPSSGIRRTLILMNPVHGFSSVQNIKAVSFTDFAQMNPNYIILSNSRLYANSGSETNWVEEYKNYRSSEEGGGYVTEIIDVNELYDQFAYGISNHSIAIRNFAHYFVNIWKNPQYLFIIGKGREYPGTRTNEDLADSRNNSFFVPTFGVPGSDNILISDLGNTVPVVPVGRLAAQSLEDVRIYLDKVRIHENPISNEQTIEDQLWKKKVIHLSGGDAVIQEIIFSFLKDMERTIEESIFGADVSTFRKTSTDPIQTATSEKIIDAINQGVSIITFFGHSAVGTFDFSLEEPGKYNNYGRYPMIISLGCHSGNIHSDALGLSEDFVIEDEKGAIAFLASSGSAYISPQYNSGNDFYGLISDSYVGESIGIVLQNALALRADNDNISVKTLNEQLTLHGDPAIKMHPKEGPDFTFDFKSVKTNPSIVSTNLDSFDLEFDIVNLGNAIEDSFEIIIRHLLPDGNNYSEKTFRIRAPEYSLKVNTKLPVPGVEGIGKNVIQLALDTKAEIKELPSPGAEANNELKSLAGEDGFCFYILDNAAKPIFPSDFSIVTKPNISLIASTSNALIEEQKYLIEIDTTKFFNSPLLEQTNLTQTGGIIEWTPAISYQPSTVYYWRISPDTTSSSIGYIWENSSFIFLPDEDEGWNQSHIYQFDDNDYYRMIFNQQRKLQFDTAGITITIHNKTYDPDVLPGLQFDFGNIAASVRPYDFMDAGLAFWVVDEKIYDDQGGVGWINGGGDYGSVNTPNLGSYRTFAFYTDNSEGRQNAINFIDNIVPEGAFVFAFTFIKTESDDYAPNQWSSDSDVIGTNLFELFESQGAAMVRLLEERGSVPYTFIFQKGRKVLAEDIAEFKYDYLRTSAVLPSLFTEGQMNSGLIGPAREWGRIVWQKMNENQYDDNYLNVYGIDIDGEKQILLEQQKELTIDISDIDTEEYPYLQLEYYSQDELEYSSPHLEHWRVFYTGLPDAALSTQENFSFHADTLQQGDDLLLKLNIRNISSIDMDSLLVKYTILSSENDEEIFLERLAPLIKKGSLSASFQKNTKELNGRYQLTVEANPDKDQPEKYSFNNFGIREFVVLGDVKNPLIDVTFDGIHIMDGDIVSPSPFILIELKDDNPFLPVDDISLFELTLKFPDGSLWAISPDDPSLNFIPASQGEENKARLEFSPELTEGEYKLFVQAKDASGNVSGNNAYEINFRVIEEIAITQVLNYPNPFSTSTQFVFTVTGDIPEVFTIRIMTLSGKVVREITKGELGNIHVGINKTDYRWDGTDEFGSRLANGVYLYKVITKTSAMENFNILSSPTDDFFHKGFGKMVIMR